MRSLWRRLAFAAFLARVGANEKKAVGAWLREHGFAQEKSGLKKKSEPEVWKEAKAFYDIQLFAMDDLKDL